MTTPNYYLYFLVRNIVGAYSHMFIMSDQYKKNYHHRNIRNCYCVSFLIKLSNRMHVLDLNRTKLDITRYNIVVLLENWKFTKYVGQKH